MNKQEIAQGLSPFVMMAFVDAQNLGTGFLTRHCINKLPKVISPQITNAELYFSTYLTKLLKLYTSY